MSSVERSKVLASSESVGSSSSFASASPITLASGEGETLRVFDSVARVLAGDRQTGGRAFVFIEESGPGAGPPLHRHSREDEYFFVLEGRYRFVMNGREFIGEAGAFVGAPCGSVHTFANLGPGRGRMLLVTVPSGGERSMLEASFREADRACRAGMPSPDEAAKIFAPAGITFEGPPIAR